MDIVTAQTRQGRISGERVAEDLVVFRGIPYASPPTGENRFRPPGPPPTWTGTRQATTFGPISLQPPPNLMSSIPGDATDQSEDCLYLNVYTRAVDDGRRPVMVFFHGGGFVGGTSTSTLYSGEHLAREGAVVIGVNYRLGALGWLGHRCLAEGGGHPAGFANWGLQDQLAALQWVKLNARSFGGDPRRVTVFGESSGAMCIAALLATDAAGRLFNRAILQSGAALAMGVDSAESIATELARELGCDEISREALLPVPGEEIVAAQRAINGRLDFVGLPYQPVVDGGLLKSHPAVAIANGSAATVDLLAGTNRDEWRFWAMGARDDMDEYHLEQLVARHIEATGLGESLTAAEVIAAYEQARRSRGDPTSPLEIYTALASDWIFRLPAMRLASAHSTGTGPGRTYAYLFDWESPFGGGALGSCHALELPFVFGTCVHPVVALFAGGGEEAEALSSRMREAWANFAATGDPSGELVGHWPQYEPSGRLTKRLGKVVEVLESPMEAERSLLDSAFGAYGEIESAIMRRVALPRAEP